MDVPGYRILRELGGAGGTRVHLATERRTNRPVALKVIELGAEAGERVRPSVALEFPLRENSPASERVRPSVALEFPLRENSPAAGREGLGRRTEARERALRRARGVAGLDHPHVVAVYDVGLVGSALYLAMEHLPDGDLVGRLRTGVSFVELLRITEQVATALDHAHAAGCLHGDVTPSNILFRDPATAVLIDFGGGAAADFDPGAETGGGRLVGTPGYMSPEQVAGRTVDGRSDLYGLGAVFFEMLTGDVPHPLDRDGTTVVPHPAAGAPRLPESFAALQELVDRFLAPDPERRFQSGAEVVRALDTVRFEAITPAPAVVRALVSTGEIEVLATSADAWREPARSGLDDGSRARTRVAPVVAGAALAVALVTGGYFAMTQPDAAAALLSRTGLTEHPEVERAWSAAEALRRDPNQSLAAIVAAYRRVLDKAPGHEEAARALSTVATTWKSDIALAIESEDFALAEAKLSESLSIFPRDSELTTLFERVSERRRADSILRGARVLLATQSMSHEPSAAAAMQALQEVLRRYPGNEEARSRLDELAGHYTTLAERAVTEGDVTDAINKLGRASSANPDYPQLARVRALISQADALAREIEAMLQRAGDLRVTAALVDPPEANAAEIYFRVLATDPGNAIAQQGLAEVAAQALVQFGGLLRMGNLADAQHLLDRAVAVGLGDTTVNEMHLRLDAEEQRLATVASLLAEAEALFRDGYFTEPAEANVVAKLREVDRLDQGNPRAAALLTRTAERLASVAQEAFEVGLAGDARYYLDLALTVTPDVDAWRGLRDAWSAEAEGAAGGG